MNLYRYVRREGNICTLKTVPPLCLWLLYNAMQSLCPPVSHTQEHKGIGTAWLHYSIS